MIIAVNIVGTQFSRKKSFQGFPTKRPSKIQARYGLFISWLIFIVSELENLPWKNGTNKDDHTRFLLL